MQLLHACLVARTLVAAHGLDLSGAHQSRNTVFTPSHACFAWVTENPQAAVDAHALVVELFDLRAVNTSLALALAESGSCSQAYWHLRRTFRTRHMLVSLNSDLWA